MQIRYSKSALKFLENLYKTIYEDKPFIAEKFLKDLKEYIELLKINPLMGKECSSKNIQDNCRVVIYKKNYIIIYKISSEKIFIKTIQNTKQRI